MWQPRNSFRLSILVIVGGVGLTALLLFWKTRPSPAAAAYNRGKTLEAVHLIVDAQATYHQAIQLDPRFAPPYRALAELAAANSDFAPSIGYWKAYLARAPKAQHAWCQLAYAELMAGLEVPALHDAERELQQDPNCGRAHLIAGVLYARKSEPRQALEHLAPAAQAYPDNPRVQLVYGRVLALSGEYDRAEPVFQGIISKDKAHAEPYYWLGYIYARRPSTPQNIQQAQKHFLAALELLPEYPEANFELGHLYFGRGKVKEALPFVEKAVANQKHYPAALYLLAQTYEALGRKSEAARTQERFRRESQLAAREKALLRLYAVDPNNLETALALGQQELALEKPESALLFLRDAAQRAPADERIQMALKRAQQLLAPAQPAMQAADPSQAPSSASLPRELTTAGGASSP